MLGVGVAGPQAIGTARRLGAVASAYDIRPETRAEAESVGATFLERTGVRAPATAATRALAAEEQLAERRALTVHIARHDVVITTAQVPGRRPPLLVDKDTVVG